MIKNLVFDLGGVLVDLDVQASLRAFTDMGYPQATKLLNPYKQSGIFLDLESGKIPPSELHDYIRKDSGKDITPAQIDGALYKFITGMHEYKLTLLLELRKKYNVYMLSNNNKITFPYIAERYFTTHGLTVADYFDHIYLSHEMGCVKPHHEIFEKMMSHGKMDPSQTIMIDDSSANLSAASELGMSTILVEPGADLKKLLNNL